MCALLARPTAAVAPVRLHARSQSAAGVRSIGLGLLALLLVASLLTGRTATARAQGPARGPSGTVAEVRIEGNTSISTEQIRTKIRTRAGRDYDENLVEEDVTRLSNTKWFSDVQVFYKKAPGTADGLIVTFRVAELPVLREVVFKGMTRLKLKEVEESTGLKAGARADFVKNQMAVNQIQRMYADKGFEWAEVRLIEGGKPGDTRAVFEIFEGPKCRLAAIEFTGNSYVSDGVLKTKITSRTAILGIGGLYHKDDVDEDARKLREYYQGQGFFEVNVRPVVHREANMGDLRVEFVIWEGVQFQVRNLKFEGNKLLDEAKLREGLLMHSGKPFSDDLREIDRKNLLTKYGAIGCIDAQIQIERQYADPEKEPGVVDLVYRIEEGNPFVLGKLVVKGNSRTLDAVIRREANMAGLVPGEPIDAQRLDKFKARLGNLKYFASSPDQGKPIDVRLVNRRPGDQPYGPNLNASFDQVMQTRMQSPEAPVAAPAVTAAAAARTRMQSPDPVVVGPRETPAPGGGPVEVAPLDGALDAGKPFAPPVDAPVASAPALVAPPPGAITPADAAAAEGRTPPIGTDVPPGMFPSIPGMNMNDVGPDRQEPFPNRSFADIVTSVDEVATGRLMFGVGASSFGGLSGNFIIHETNFDILKFPRSVSDVTQGRAFRGRGQDFRLEISPGTSINRASVSFRDPYLFNLPIGFGASGYAFSRFYPDWNERRVGGRFSLGRQFGTLTYADVAFRAEDVNFNGFKYPAPAEYLAASGHTTLMTLRPSLRFDNRNDPYSPNKGQYLEFAFEQGWGDFTFPKLTVEGRQYFTLGSRPDGSGKRILTLRGFYGVTGQDTPVYERFFAGDFRSMRGFAYRGVGPYVMGSNIGGVQMALGSVEFQFPWTANDKLQQVVFSDFGTVTDDYSFNAFRCAVGTGLRIYLPQQLFGPLPLAFDLAFPVVTQPGDKERYFTFFIGAFW